MLFAPGAEFIKQHADFGEVFKDWKLYESARACNRFFTKYGLLKEFLKTMAQCVDFLHPRIHNSVVLQSIQFVTNAVATALYDGVSDEDLNIVILELCKMCVPHFAVGVCMFLICK